MGLEMFGEFHSFTQQIFEQEYVTRNRSKFYSCARIGMANCQEGSEAKLN